MLINGRLKESGKILAPGGDDDDTLEGFGVLLVPSAEVGTGFDIDSSKDVLMGDGA